jgi:hypothetical protein
MSRVGDRCHVSSAVRILDRLERVKQTAPGRWLARCPAHEDKSPSLSIRQLDDGRILLHDFAGCEVGDVLAALGLQLQDLFPERLPGVGEARSYPQSHSHIPARDLLEIISEETSVVAIVASHMLANKTISESDWQRLATAASRIHRARDHGHDR